MNDNIIILHSTLLHPTCASATAFSALVSRAFAAVLVTMERTDA
jgi:hypothetical protein